MHAWWHSGFTGNQALVVVLRMVITPRPSCFFPPQTPFLETTNLVPQGICLLLPTPLSSTCHYSIFSSQIQLLYHLGHRVPIAFIRTEAWYVAKFCEYSVSKREVRGRLRQQRAYGSKVCKDKQPLTPLIFLGHLRYKTDEEAHSQNYRNLDGDIQVETCQKG